MIVVVIRNICGTASREKVVRSTLYANQNTHNVKFD